MPNLGLLRVTCLIDGEEVPPPVSGTITSGFDQDHATCDLVFPSFVPSWVSQYSRVTVLLGRDNYVQRFDGFIVPWEMQLWPPRETLRCGDWLKLLEYIYPTEPIDLVGLTPGEIVWEVLDQINFPTNLRNFTRLGKIVSEDSSPATYWPAEQSGAELIAEMDQIDNKRSYIGPDGMFRRESILVQPFDVAGYTFYEGLNVLPGSLTFEPINAITQVTVTGASVLSMVEDDEPETWRPNPFAVTFARIQRQLEDAGAYSTDEIAAATLARVNRNMVRSSFSTFEDRLFWGRETIGLVAPHLRSNGNWWLQSTVVEWSGTRFRQTLNTISHRQTIGGGVPGIGNPYVGLPVIQKPPLGPPATVTIPAAFTIIAINKERLADGSTLYDVTVESNSTSPVSTIVTDAWTASGPGANPTTGT
jgi:hypothetical protein